MRRSTTVRLTVALSVIAILAITAGCRNSDTAPPLPTRTPPPTFTPEPEVVLTPVDPAAASTARAVAPAPAEQTQPESDQAATQPEEQQPQAEQATDTPVPPPTPVPAAEVVVNSNMNVRQGPGTNYGIVGAANSGERYSVTGRNDSSSWWQIDFRGQDGWVFGDLVSAQNAEGVAVAQNIPAPPPPTAVPPTQPPAPAPEPAQPAEPAPAPEPSYEFSRAILQRCDPNEGVTYVEGTTYRNGQPTSGLEVAFSYAVDGPVVASVQSGPHEGYPGWRAGFYSHILSTNGPRGGDWYFWIVNDSGQRISAAGHVHTDDSAGDGKCQQAVIDFDT